MVNDPERKLDWFAFGEGDYVSVHYEATQHLSKALAMIKARGAKVMVALNPATPTCAPESVLDDIDGVLIMTVNPDFAGQSMIESTLKKIDSGWMTVAMHILRLKWMAMLALKMQSGCAKREQIFLWWVLPVRFQKTNLYR